MLCNHLTWPTSADGLPYTQENGVRAGLPLIARRLPTEARQGEADMTKDIVAYFERTIMPLIAAEHAEVASDLTVQVLGSYGLGIADELSDLEVAIWLDDPEWQAHGAQLQLTLLRGAPRFAHTPNHPELCVWPLSWLGDRRAFLDSDADPPWEKVSIEQLHELQNALVLRDPHDIFRRLKAATAPERFPQWLWRRFLVSELVKLVVEDPTELRQAARRRHAVEGHIVLGCVLHDLMRIGFILNRTYYPWRTHLRWAFERLPFAASEALPYLDTATSSPVWEERLAAVDAVRDLYCEHIQRYDLLPGIDMSTSSLIDEFTWAQRLEAWSNPDWRERVTKWQAMARGAGCDAADFWVWSLWRCAESDQNDRGELNDGDR